MKFNENLHKLDNQDSFYVVSEKIRKYKENHPDNKVISLGIGDVCFPIIKPIADKMIEAIKEESNTSSFVGYGNYYGLPELRKLIRDNEYPSFDIEEIYVSQGTKSDVGDILELFDKDSLIGIPTPNYPIYLNSVISLGKKVKLIPCDMNFIPIIPKEHFDVIYFCSPNNPVGITYSKETLSKWIEYAKKEDAVILFDNAYHHFVSSGVDSIYEIEGSKEVAIEFRSFSKVISFSGIRCSYYVIPKQLHRDINSLWRVRTINRFNGASYVAQKGAIAYFDSLSKKEIDKNILYYLENAKILKDGLTSLGYKVYGGENAPYLWVKSKNNFSSWESFDYFLNKLEIVVIPGVIFGKEGEGYFRVSALGKREDILLAIKRIEYDEEAK